MYPQSFSIVRPGGNDTAVVWDNVTRQQQAAIASLIQKTYPGIEQVMFVERNPETGKIRGQMAGGEFCGNATRSLGYLLLNGKEGSIDLEVSGTSQPMTVMVKDGSAQTMIPINKNLSSVVTLDNGEMVVNLEGISHLITCTHQPSAQRMAGCVSDEMRKDMAKQILVENNLATLPAPV